MSSRWMRMTVGICGLFLVSGSGAVGASPKVAASAPTSATAPTTMAAEGDLPSVTHVGTVAPNVVLVKIRAQRVERGRQVPYEPHPNDVVNKGQHQYVTRDGKMVGALVGADRKIIFTIDRLLGEPLDVQWATNPSRYRLFSEEDEHFASGVVPKAISRKSRPYQYARTSDDHGSAQDHFLYLQLSEPLQSGKRYTLKMDGGNVADDSVEFTYDPATQLSDAIHVTQIGFRPDDPVKVAFLSCWMGDGGGLEYQPDLKFSVIDDNSGKEVFSGTTRLSKAAEEGESGTTENHQMTDVYEMDFTALTTPGNYRVSVEGVGCSMPFPIAEDVWAKAFFTSVRGLYHQRSGIALGPPYTEYKRPRAFHPDDGVKVYHTDYSPGEGPGGGFRAIVAGKTDEIVENAWGGYMDAGDWDRRPIHTYVPRLLMDLYEMAPDKFESFNLNIPESNDSLPDVLNEALWWVDFHVRTQTPEGGIRPGIESSEHPRRGEGSWQESLTVMAYAPNANMSYKFAAVAVRAALLLKERDPDLSKKYLDSAQKAFDWAEAQAAGKPAAKNDGERTLAAVEFFRFTGDAKWHEMYVSQSRYKDAENLVYNGHKMNSGIYDPQDEAGWTYYLTDRPGMDQSIKDNFKKALLTQADARVADIQNTAFRWVASKGKAIGYSASVIPDAVALVRAHRATKDEKYLKAIVLTCQHGAGANPLNLSYTTGVGTNYQQNMVHEDYYVSSQALPPGLTVNGPRNPRDPAPANHAPTVKSFARAIYPDMKTWPTLECYFDLGVFSPMSEYTVHRNIAPNAYAWGYLGLAR